LHPTSKGTKTLATIFHQLHHCLEGKEILMGDISELDTPLKYFFNGTLPHNLGKATEDHYPPNTSFSVQGEPFPPPYWNRNDNGSFSSIFIKVFGGPFISFKRLCLDDGQHVESFLVGYNQKKNVAKKLLQKSLQEVADLKGQLQQLQTTNWQDALTSNIYRLNYRIWKAQRKEFTSWKLKIPTTGMSYQNSTNGLSKLVKLWAPSIWNKLC